MTTENEVTIHSDTSRVELHTLPIVSSRDHSHHHLLTRLATSKHRWFCLCLTNPIKYTVSVLSKHEPTRVFLLERSAIINQQMAQYYCTVSKHEVNVLSHDLPLKALSNFSWPWKPLPSFLGMISPPPSAPSSSNRSRDNYIFTLSLSVPLCQTSSLRTRPHDL